MARKPHLGPKQLALLSTIGTTRILMTPSKRAVRLAELGFVKIDRPDGCGAVITPNGLRALADAVDAGRYQLPTMKGGK